MVALLFSLLFVTQPALSQKAGDDLKDLRKDVQSLKEGQATIQKELREIKNLLQTKQAQTAKAQDIVMSVKGAHFKGEENAKVTIFEFSDYQ